MSEPRISAVITAYNSARFVAQAIESVLAQTRIPDEILVVDDGSVDETHQVISPYLERGLVRYMYQANQGAGAARNLGIQHTTGDYLAFLDADDLWLEDKTQRQEEILRANPQVMLVSGQPWWWDLNTDKRWIVPVTQKSTFRGRCEILVNNWIGNPSMVMLRRSALDQVGLFNPTFRWGQDWELWIRMVSRFEVRILPEPVIIYRSNETSLSHTNQQKERLDCLWDISRSAIAAFQPAWLRPVLLMRSWSELALQHAEVARKVEGSRGKQLAYASLALLSDPFESSGYKFKELGRAIVGERAYQQIRHAFKPR